MWCVQALRPHTRPHQRNDVPSANLLDGFSDAENDDVAVRELNMRRGFILAAVDADEVENDLDFNSCALCAPMPQ